MILMEIGSADMLYLTAVSAHSKMPWVCFAAGLAAVISCYLLAIFFAGLLQKSFVPLNLASGVMLIVTGILFLWKS